MTDDHVNKLLIYSEDTARSCGDCQLCCRLLPMPELEKPAGKRCKFQKFHKGCTIYARRPPQCRYWSCRWLLGNDTHDVPRPDRAHYVIDTMPDYFRMVHNETKELVVNVECVQVWIDPSFPDAHRDPALRRYLLRRGDEGIAALIRYDNRKAMALIPPQMTDTREWREVWSDVKTEKQHSLIDYFRAQEENKRIAAAKTNGGDGVGAGVDVGVGGGGGDGEGVGVGNSIVNRPVPKIKVTLR